MPGKTNGNGLTNGLNKARIITGIIGSVIGATAFFVTILFFFFNLRAGQENLKTNFERHCIESTKKLDRITDESNKRFEQFVPEKEISLAFENIKASLNDIKYSLTACQEEDKQFKEKIFNLMLEMKKAK